MTCRQAINRALQEDERAELRWLRPDGTEAVAVVMTYTTKEAASDAVDACLTALEEGRRAGSRPHVVIGSKAVEP